MPVGDLPHEHPERRLRLLQAEVARLQVENEKLIQRVIKAEWNYHLEIGESRFLRALMLSAEIKMRCPNADVPVVTLPHAR